MDEGDQRAAVLAAEARRREALIAVDVETLDRLFADDLMHVHSNGIVHDKPSLLRHIESRRSFLNVERGGLSTRFYGGMAILSGPMTNLMRSPQGDDPMRLEGHVTQLLRPGPLGWRFHFFQFTLYRPA